MQLQEAVTKATELPEPFISFNNKAAYKSGKTESDDITNTNTDTELLKAKRMSKQETQLENNYNGHCRTTWGQGY